MKNAVEVDRWWIFGMDTHKESTPKNQTAYLLIYLKVFNDWRGKCGTLKRRDEEWEGNMRQLLCAMIRDVSLAPVVRLEKLGKGKTVVWHNFTAAFPGKFTGVTWRHFRGSVLTIYYYTSRKGRLTYKSTVQILSTE